MSQDTETPFASVVPLCFTTLFLNQLIKSAALYVR